ncbi:MAG: arsenate reductase ArsC [Microbacteriaceae bacterium]|nr:arsenate reductase ArsC [Microbacteriaceae bacterium]
MRFGRLLAAAPGQAGLRRVGDAGLPPTVERIARQLQYRYASVFSPETVRKYVAESYALLAERARIRTYLPTLTTKYATDRLSALATASGLSPKGTPEVLFVCVHNAGRSQLASSIMQHIAGDRIHVRSAGTAPAPAVEPAIRRLLDEIGVPFAQEFPKPLTTEVVQASDVVVTMGCGDACPVYPGRRYLNWELDDPAALPIDGARRVRDEVYDRVERLTASIT